MRFAILNSTIKDIVKKIGNDITSYNKEVLKVFLSLSIIGLLNSNLKASEIPYYGYFKTNSNGEIIFVPVKYSKKEEIKIRNKIKNDYEKNTYYEESNKMLYLSETLNKVNELILKKYNKDLSGVYYKIKLGLEQIELLLNGAGYINTEYDINSINKKHGLVGIFEDIKTKYKYWKQNNTNNADINEFKNKAKEIINKIRRGNSLKEVMTDYIELLEAYKEIFNNTLISGTPIFYNSNPKVKNVLKERYYLEMGPDVKNMPLRKIMNKIIELTIKRAEKELNIENNYEPLNMQIF